MAQRQHRIVAVIDPTRSEQWALQHAVDLAKKRGGSEVVAYLCASSSLKTVDEAELTAVEERRQALWLNEILADFSADGVAVKPLVQSAADWKGAIVETAEELGANVVVKRNSVRPKSVTNSDRHLIRNLQCAILLVKSEPKTRYDRILAAMNFNADDHDHVALNDAVLNVCNDIRSRSAETELHVVNAYAEPMQFVHPPDIAKKVGIERSQVHSIEGRPPKIIGSVARDIDADLVVLGNVGRRGLKGISIGNTAEKMLSEFGGDLLIISRETQAERGVETVRS
ncbi:MAG: universal stress protein [Pseudomonadota bacterium]